LATQDASARGGANERFAVGANERFATNAIPGSAMPAAIEWRRSSRPGRTASARRRTIGMALVRERILAHKRDGAAPAQSPIEPSSIDYCFSSRTAGSSSLILAAPTGFVPGTS
jgi:hypothetical protein